MNWTEIEKSYPKAYKKYADWFHHEHGVAIGLTDTYDIRNDNIRELYDFFDDNNIHISMIPYDNRKWSYYILNMNNNSKDVRNCNYDTRKDAEGDAFTKAFEILNNQLK